MSQRPGSRKPRGPGDPVEALQLKAQPVTSISGEAFVASVTVQRNGDVFTRQASEMEHRYRGRVRERFSVVPRERGKHRK